MNTETQNRAAEIAALNDEHRRSMEGCIVTKGVAVLGPIINDIFVRVRDFKKFTEDNDPYGEHDFGSFELLGIKDNIKAQIARFERMDETLYDDRLTGDITKERYDSKHAAITKQIEDLREQLNETLFIDPTKHDKAVGLLCLSQSAQAEFMTEDLSNAQRRTILTELFDSIVYKAGSISVNYTDFVETIAHTVAESKRKLKEANMLNRTDKKDPNNRGQNCENIQMDLLRPVWQGLQDDYRTFCDVVRISDDA